MSDAAESPALAKWNRLKDLLLRHAIAQGASSTVKLRNFTAHPPKVPKPSAPETL